MRIKKSIRFITLILLLLIIISGTFYGRYRTSTAFASNPELSLPQSFVSIVQSSKTQAADISYSELKTMVLSAINSAGSLSGIVKDGDTVILKPNLVVMSYAINTADYDLIEKEANGITTDWRIVKIVAEAVRKLNPNGKIYVMEGTAAKEINTNQAYTHFNYDQQHMPMVDGFIELEKDSGDWRDYSSDKLVKVSVNDELSTQSIYYNKLYYTANVIISLPCLKTHNTAVITGGIKNVSVGAAPANIYGRSPTALFREVIPHDRIPGHRWIRNFYKNKPVNFVVMDSLQGLENGPISKLKANMRLIIASKDAVAIDTIEALLCGWDPEEIDYLKFLAADKLGNTDVSKITVTGKQVDKVRKYLASVCTYATCISDKKAPQIKIKSSSFKKGKLNLSLNTENDTKKVELYMNGKLLPQIITENFGKITLSNVPYNKSSKNTLDIYAYDRFLNRTKVRTIFK